MPSVHIEPDTPIVQRVATFLSAHPGHAFCGDCLAQRLRMDRRVAWTAALRLGESREFDVDVGICSSCLDRLDDVAHVRWITPSQPEAPSKARIRVTYRPPGSTDARSA
ncbi:MAG: hypothetical protein HYU41_06875 [Candidatus Rokubacteria bacterium]|nr:hypothetical protein [Candidatus Rokubacteria bacterium]